MNIKTGIDLIEITRVDQIMKNHGQRFLNRIFAREEIDYLKRKKNNNIRSIAARFCAKEACAKALGTGIGYISWKDILVLTDEKGKPFIRLKGKAKELSGESLISVSLTHSKECAMAMVIIYG